MNRSTLRWLSFVAIAITLLSLLPQLHLWLARGAQWNGAYATVDGDEFLYSAYINALMDGRPRRNDPFAGRDDNPKAPLPESTFSIQLVPPFVIASLAKIFRVSASTAFIVLMALAGLLASLTIFWLLFSISGDSRLTAVGTLLVVCFGTAAAGQGLLGVLLTGDASVGLLFLRRYQPAASFFLFFVFCTLTWRALTAESVLRSRLFFTLAPICFGLLVFSYLYLWSAALAWLLLVNLFWLWFRRTDVRRVVYVLGSIAAAALLVFPPYAYLLSLRAANLAEAQTLISTHRPDLLRIPELIAVVVLLLFIQAVRAKRITTGDPRFIFGISFAALPFLLFNQQVITGKTIQAFHYQDFIANYVVLLGLVILMSLWSRSFSPRILVWLLVLCSLWGVTEVQLPAQARYASNTVNDEMVPVLQRLNRLALDDGTLSSLRNEGKAPGLVFSPHSEVMRLLPTWTPYGTLLGLGGLDFGSASREEPKVYAYVYYCGVHNEGFRDLLNGKPEDGLINYYTRSAVFGHERVLPKLTYNFEPISQDEIEGQVRFYEHYAESFSRDEALKHPIAYVVVLTGTEFDFSRIDRWYERTLVENIGPYDLYKLKLY
jgi:hypothetical protein